MSSLHTPGPWVCVPTSHHYHDYRLESPTGQLPFTRGSTAVYANAKLMGAAPELVGALQSCHRTLRKQGYDMTQIDAALLKAGVS